MLSWTQTVAIGAEFLKVESARSLAEDHTTLLPGHCEVWRMCLEGLHVYVILPQA